MAGGELDDVNRRLAAAAVVFINAASGIAEALLAARTAQLRGAAEQSREHAQRVRAQVAAARRADAVVWRAASRALWWQKATAQDVARAWQAAHAWHHVDHGAADALRLMRQRLAERGVTVDERGPAPVGDLRWLETALALAATEQALADRKTVLEAGFDHADADRDRMAEMVRREWSPEAADSVLASEAWPAMAYRLHELEVLGGDLPAVLATVNLEGARNPAALAEWQIENTINSMLLAEVRAAGVLASRPELLAELDQEAARTAVLEYGAARLHIAQGQLDNAKLDEALREKLDAHGGRLRDLLAEIPDSGDVVATVAQREPVLLTVLKDGPLGELATRRAELADSRGPNQAITVAAAPGPGARPVRPETAVLDAAHTRAADSSTSAVTKDLLAAAFPTSAAEAVAKAATQHQRGAPAGRSRSRARSASVKPDRGR